jgi:type I restriction enzyme S subunit
VIPLGPQVNHRFVNYVLQSPQVVAWLTTRLQGSVTQKINLATLRDVPVPLPPAWEQAAIAELLGAIDDKIEANSRLVAVVDDLWRSSVSAVIQSIEENEISRVDGELLPLSSLAAFINGRAFTKNATGTGRMVVRIAELNSGPAASTVYNNIDVPSDYLADPGDLLFAWSGSLTVQRWFRPQAIVNQHIFKVVPQPHVPVWLVHAHLLHLLPGYKRIAAGKATTMGHIQRRDLDAAVILPGQTALANLDAVCSPLWRRALRAEMENLSLSDLRDALLPKLLSGELRVRTAEERVGEAV